MILSGSFKVLKHAYPVYLRHDFRSPFFFFLLFAGACSYRRIGFGMKLRADHIFIETDTHHSSFIRNMRAFFSIQRILAPISSSSHDWVESPGNPGCQQHKKDLQAIKYRFIFSILQHMNRKYTKSSGFSFTNNACIKITAG